MAEKGKVAAGSACCIIGAGEIPDYAGVREQIPADAFVISADGGYDHCEAMGLKPDLLMGDFDSLEGPIPQEIPRITLPVGKDYTDSAFAAEEPMDRGYRRIVMAGMLGGRLDHTLANIQCAGSCAERGGEIILTDGVTTIYALAAGEVPAVLAIPPVDNHYFSLFSLRDRCRSVTIRGGVYPLEQYPLGSLDPRAVSNEFKGETVTVTLTDGVLIVVVTPK